MRQFIRRIFRHVGTVDMNLVTSTPEINNAVRLYWLRHGHLLNAIELDRRGYIATSVVDDMSEQRELARLGVEQAIRAANPDAVKSAVRAHVNRLTSTEAVKQFS